MLNETNSTIEKLENLDILEYSELEAQYKVNEEIGFQATIIIDNLPIISESKEEKLLAVLTKNIFKPAKATAIPDSIMMPRDDESGKSKGYLFIEFTDEEEAKRVLEIADGYKLDKSHVLSAIPLEGYKEIINANEEYQEPTIEPYQEQEYAKSWLIDEYARDQFATLTGRNVEIYWNARNGQEPELAYKQDEWTETFTQWSTHGTLFATIHSQGVMLWGGKSWRRVAKFAHPRVRMISFSSTDSYLVTWSPWLPAHPKEANLLVWDVKTNALVRSFVVGNRENSANTASSIQWPMIKFSFDDKFAGRMLEAGEDALAIYEIPTFSLVDKKTIRIEGLMGFAWSPTNHHLVHWTIGTENVPTRVSVIDPRNRLVIRAKNIFNVTSLDVFWQSKGQYLALMVQRHSKNKKKTLSSLELFRLQEKDVPVECLEFTEPITFFAWEGKTDRFVAVSTQGFESHLKFYTMSASENGLSTVKQLAAFTRKALSEVLWSPRGTFLLLVGHEANVANIEIFDASDMRPIACKEHFLGTDVAWDPSGRFIASWVSAWKQSSDHGYLIWDIRGEQLAKKLTPRFVAFQWRPRPPSLLTPAQKKEIRKNLKEYSSVFEQKDLQELLATTSSHTQQKSSQIKIWNEWRRHCRREYDCRTPERLALIGVEDEWRLGWGEGIECVENDEVVERVLSEEIEYL